jgi:hypothetical protein
MARAVRSLFKMSRSTHEWTRQLVVEKNYIEKAKKKKGKKGRWANKGFYLYMWRLRR